MPSCSLDKNNDNDNLEDEDPWSEIRDVKPGEVKFDGEYFCYYDCFNDDKFCGTRPIKDCDLSKLHQDFFNYDCFVVVDFGSYNTEPPEEKFGLTWIICFCGRSGNTYSGTFSIETVFEDCDDYYTMSPRSVNGKIIWEGTCKDNCNPCKANCTGKECGSNGCGGSCGTCPPGEKCSTAGKCISESSGDPCSACLSTCQGLPSCCTGCGCLCEDECGQCF